ncbi:Kcnh7 [Symbiodinium sp. CCMP2592]|nr:Kcnh7 [Symbiodinium sp. CCMP2592]
MLGRWALILIAFVQSHANRLRLAGEQLEQGDWLVSRLLNARMWTWNSGKADLKEEALRLSQIEADFIVSCQTEASKPLRDWMPAQWKEVAHGQHWGAAGGNINAQMASLFARRPLNGEFIGNSSEVISMTPWSSVLGPEHHIAFAKADASSEVLLFSTQTQVLASDYKGKGGVAMTLSFPASPARPATRVDFICAHLDSESANKRHMGITYLLSKLRARDKKSKILSEEVISKSGELKKPCGIFDRDSPTCDLPEVEGLDEGPDAVIMLGDLNFRLRQGELGESENPLSTIEAQLLSPAGRRKLAANDPLWDQSPFADSLVKSVEDNSGFGFTCNEPYTDYLPTYKRHGAQECKLLGEKLANCGGADHRQESASYCHMDELLNLTRNCYMKPSKKDGNLTWAAKHEDLQLGWLDRFCFRTTRRGSESELSLSLKDNAGWMDYPGAADGQNGSDHMPVEAMLQIGHAKCSCPAASDGIMIEGCDNATVAGPVFRTGELTSVRCEGDSWMVDKHGRHVESIMFQCLHDGSIAPVDRRSEIFDWTCRKVCKGYAGPGPVMDGALVYPSCPDPSLVYLGATVLRCRDGHLGTLAAHEVMPSCVKSCHVLPPLAGDAWVKSQLPASEQLLSGDHAREIRSRFAESKVLVLDGGEQHYECQGSCTVLGTSTAKCIESEMQPAIRCACRLTLVVQSAVFSNKELQSQVDYVKLQFFNGATTEEQLEQMRQGSKYVAAMKFRLDELPKLGKELENLADLQAHVTLCSKTAGRKRHYFSSCRILAETDLHHAQSIKKLLGQVTSTEGPLTVDFRLNATSVKLQFHYSAADPSVKAEVRPHSF